MEHEASMTTSVDNIEFNSNKDPKTDCEKLGLNWIDVAPEVDEEIINLLDAELAVRLRVLPIAIESGRLSIAMLNPTDIEASDEVATITAYPITRCGMDKQIFSDLMRNYYGTTAARMAESLAQYLVMRVARRGVSIVVNHLTLRIVQQTEVLEAFRCTLCRGLRVF